MLIALSILLFGGGGSEGMWLFPPNFSQKVNVVVVEENKRDEILSLFNEIDKSINKYDDRVREIAKKLHQTVRIYDATDMELNKLSQKLLQERKMVQTQIFDARFKMAEKLTDQEWKDIFLLTDPVPEDN